MSWLQVRNTSGEIIDTAFIVWLVKIFFCLLDVDIRIINVLLLLFVFALHPSIKPIFTTFFHPCISSLVSVQFYKKSIRYFICHSFSYMVSTATLWWQCSQTVYVYAILFSLSSEVQFSQNAYLRHRVVCRSKVYKSYFIEMYTCG